MILPIVIVHASSGIRGDAGAPVRSDGGDDAIRGYTLDPLAVVSDIQTPVGAQGKAKRATHSRL